MFDPAPYFRHHHVVAVIVLGLCLWVSLSLAIQMWMKHPGVGTLSKMCWSLVLFVPLLGWMVYGGFFAPPSVLHASDRANVTLDATTGGQDGH